MLRLTTSAWMGMLGHAWDGLPDEACGLLVGHAIGDRVVRFVPTGNEAASAKLYAVPGRDWLRAERDAEAEGLGIIGVMHSHTHTDAYPSPTDIEAAPDPSWHYVIVSLRDDAPVLRSWRIVEGAIAEERVVVDG